MEFVKFNMANITSRENGLEMILLSVNLMSIAEIEQAIFEYF